MHGRNLSFPAQLAKLLGFNTSLVSLSYRGHFICIAFYLRVGMNVVEEEANGMSWFAAETSWTTTMGRFPHHWIVKCVVL